MKKSKSMIAGLISAFVCGLCVLTYMGIVQQEADSARNDVIARYGGEQVEVLVAKRDINPGEMIDGSNTLKKLWISDLLPEGSITNASDAYGKKVDSFVATGEVLLTKRFETSTLGIEVPEGLVALSVPAQDINAVGGAITKGSYVDVYAVGTSTTCLGRSIGVLATSNADEASAGQKMNWITLAIDPAKVQEFVSAAENLEIYFTLPGSKKADDQHAANGESKEASTRETLYADALSIIPSA
ncbi:MAG: Flp pilus assembly protein CpaB [Eggerthellaceae bacterium]|nr:Flp pilus assembly protein CpaB [Eggerthellaceae bacterium]